MHFEGKTVLITGAARGLGRSYAELLGSLGAKVMINDIVGAESTAAYLEKMNIDCVWDANDASNRDGALALAESAFSVLGKVDILINNAGIGRFSPMAEVSLDDYELVRRVGLDASFYLTHAIWPSMIKQQYGRIIFTTSGVGLVGQKSAAAYAVSKAGVYGLMRVLAIEGAEHGIHVNAIAPVAFTPMLESFVTPEESQKMRELYDVEKVARAVAVLAHTDCPSSGCVIDAAGGMVGTSYISSAPGIFDPTLSPDDLLRNWASVTDPRDAQGFKVASEFSDTINRLASEYNR